MYLIWRKGKKNEKMEEEKRWEREESWGRDKLDMNFICVPHTLSIPNT